MGRDCYDQSSRVQLFLVPDPTNLQAGIPRVNLESRARHIRAAVPESIGLCDDGHPTLPSRRLAHSD